MAGDYNQILPSNPARGRVVTVFPYDILNGTYFLAFLFAYTNSLHSYIRLTPQVLSPILCCL